RAGVLARYSEQEWIWASSWSSPEQHRCMLKSGIEYGTLVNLEETRAISSKCF
ncbi:hypothetical protein A2U01_0069884, partial [Trifolium medium]|nr:hypothetical protein [Trifolium medium]